jgi:sorbitol-specific phosphotransferase system component IIBC
MSDVTCSACGGALIQRSRARLAAAGLAMCAAPLIAWFIPLRSPLFWVPAVIAALAGVYLLLWSTIGRGRWCRQCKAFRI